MCTNNERAACSCMCDEHQFSHRVLPYQSSCYSSSVRRLLFLFSTQPCHISCLQVHVAVHVRFSGFEEGSEFIFRRGQERCNRKTCIAASDCLSLALLTVFFTFYLLDCTSFSGVQHQKFFVLHFISVTTSYTYVCIVLKHRQATATARA